MVSWTWATQPDPLIDTGRELYIPWQITQGKVLYRDIAYFNGPLSPYFNALLYRDNTDFGAAYFGSDYAVDFARWIQANYQPVAWFGSRPTMRPDPNGIVLWWHKS